MRFQVKKNPILVGICLSIPPIMISLPIISLIEGDGVLFSFIIFFLLSPVMIMLVWAFFKTYHEITETEFRSIFGFIKIEIPLHEIKSVTYSNNSASSPAWTFKRLKIEYQKYGFVLLSLPKDEEAFQNEVKLRCPYAVVKNRNGEILANK